MREEKKTANAVKILHRRYINDLPERKAAIQEERVNAQVAQLIYDLRKGAGLSQKQLADMIGTTQSVISRLEDSDYEGHSLSMLEKITKALNRRVRIDAISDNSTDIHLRLAFQTLIKLLRKKSGFDVEQFARKIGVEKDEIIELEQNISHRPTPRVLYRLSQIFKIPQEKLNFLAGAIKEIPQNLQIHASQFAAQSDSFDKLTDDQKRLVDEFVKFLRQESR
ncbi:helix-turn-helix domain-containing protein [candidate division KSB1 bacterium]|nr:helix-turn-helix domain-containing protein [candidate division KSB1 bacterium]